MRTKCLPRPTADLRTMPGSATLAGTLPDTLRSMQAMDMKPDE